MASSASDTLVFGDDQGNVFFVRGADGTLTRTQQILYGNVLAEPALSNGVAYCAASNPGGNGAVYAFDAISGDQLGEGPITLDASADATPVVAGTTLYVATASGHLLAFDVSRPASPAQLWNLDVMRLGSGTATVAGLVLARGGRLICLVTHAGVYAVDLSQPAQPSVAWSSATATAFDQAPPLLVEDRMLYAVSGATLSCWDLAAAPGGGSLAAAWTWDAPSGQPLAHPWRLAFGQLLVADAAGHFWGLDSGDRTRLTPLAINATGASGQQANLFGSVLLLAAPSGDAWAYRLELDASGLTSRQLWHATLGVTVPGAPYAHVLVGPTRFGTLVFVPATDGSVRALGLEQGTTVWSGSLGTPGSRHFGSSAFSLPTQSTAAVSFVLDGQDYFLTLRDLLVSAAYGSLTGGVLPNCSNIRTFIRYVGAQGSNAYVLLWDAGEVARIAAGAWGRITGAGVGLNLNANRTSKLTIPGENVQVELEPYSPQGGWFGAAQHQKLSVFSIAGVKIALVAGLNLSPEYWDTAAHPMTGEHLTSWHDTALVVQGDAAALVEREFDRRWTKVTGAPPAPKGDSYAKVAVWELDRDARLDEWGAAEGSARPTPYTNRSVGSAPVPVNVLVTDGEAPRRTQIRDGLVAAIANAQQYAYFENCAFYDAALVRALAAKYERPGSTFQTIVMIPQPVAKPDGTQSAYFALSKAAWCALLLALGTWESVTVPPDVFPTVTTLKRSDCAEWRIVWGDRLEHTQLRVRMNGYANAYSAFVTQIVDVATTESRVTLCGPARYFATPPASRGNALPAWPVNYRYLYIHSKLALFDDATAFVGSANFTERSMLIDGELSVSVSDGPTTLGIRQALFRHWGMDAPSEWRQDMAAFERTTADGVGVLPLTVGNLSGKANLAFATWAMTGLTNI